jgi:formate dehydrogenase
MATILCVLYPDPVTGFPPEYARDEIPEIGHYHDGQITPTPKAIDFTPDHVDLDAAIDNGVTVAEVTYCNSISVAEHVVMMILGLVRNYLPSYQTVLDGAWNIADCAERSYDLEGMQVGTVAAGRIGSAVLRRLAPFEVGLHYTDRHRLPEAVEQELNLTFHPDAKSMVGECDVVTINAPLHP